MTVTFINEYSTALDIFSVSKMLDYRGKKKIFPRLLQAVATTDDFVEQKITERGLERFQHNFSGLYDVDCGDIRCLENLTQFELSVGNFAFFVQPVDLVPQPTSHPLYSIELRFYKVDQDFRILFPDADDSLFMKWPRCSGLLFPYAEKKLVDWKESLHFHQEPDTDERKVNLSLQILPLIFPPGMKKECKTVQRAKVEVACNALIQKEPIGSNIPELLEKSTIGSPSIVILGSMEAPEQCFVTVERKTIACSSLLQAVDVCFKLVYILDVEFAWECQHVWDFIQKNIYGLGLSEGRVESVPRVRQFANYLQKKV